ncbi:MAG: hypothetical protein HYX27_14275 [Acidobacteria bacterium]|nr:hypothetical protein [Acidobacteriota bacterium]
MEDFRELLLAAAKENRSVQVYAGGQTIPMLVTGVGLEYLEGKSREFSKILVRMDKIDAVAKT